MTTHVENFEFIVHGICLTTVGVAGLVANTAILLVLRRPALKCGSQVSAVGGPNLRGFEAVLLPKKFFSQSPIQVSLE